MGAHNFWHNFTHGFMHGMFGSNPFFGCWSGFMPTWGNPFMFGGFNSCFNPFMCNSNLFITPSVFTNNFYSLMPDMSMPSVNMNFDMTKLFPTDNVWDMYNQQQQMMQNPFDSFEKTTEQEKAENTLPDSSDSINPEGGNNDKKSEKKAGEKTLTENPNAAKSSSVSNNKVVVKKSSDIKLDLQNDELTDKFTGTAEQLNKILNKKNGVLKNKGQVFLDAQERYGINAAILAAICINESAYGTSNMARTKNNVGGVSKGKGFKSYNSVDECIMDMARFLKSGYVDKGIVTIAEVGKKYCPVGDPRDKKGLNSGWGKAVASITGKIETLA